MPQFDTLSFYSQIFWILFAFGFLYSFSLKGVLVPKIILIKLRNKIN